MLYNLFRRSVSIMNPNPVAHYGIPLTSVGSSIWRADRAIKLPFGITLPLSMVIMANDDRQLLLYSPILLDNATRAALDTLGTVRWIVSPNP